MTPTGLRRSTSPRRRPTPDPVPFTLGNGGDHVAAFWNVVGHVALGLGGVWLGFYLGLWRERLRWIGRRPNPTIS